MTLRGWSVIALGIFAAGVVVGIAISDGLPGGRTLIPSFVAPASGGSIDRVVDGDTVRFFYRSAEPVSEPVRLLCLDTPERGERGYQEATDALEALLSIEPVRMEFPGDEPERDRYGRLLAYLYAGGVNVNVEMVRLGWSEYVQEFGPSELFHDAFVDAEREARAERRGLWRR
jgi:micrococcal nuclease